MASWFHDLGLFGAAVGAHWQALATGGFVTAAVNMYERRKNKNISWQSYAFIVGAFFLYSLFAAWQDEHRNTAVVINEKAILASQYQNCITDARVERAYQKGIETLNGTQRQTIDSQQRTIDRQQADVTSCVISLGKMNPVLNTHISVAAVKVASNEQAKNRFYGIAIMTNRKLDPRGTLKCNEPLQVTDISLQSKENVVSVPPNTIRPISDTEWSIGINYVPAFWEDGNPIMAVAYTASENDMHCTFSPSS